MMSLRNGWGWQPPQTASQISLRHLKSAWAHWYAVHGHKVAAINSYTHTTWLIFCGVTCVVKMMSLCHGWGWQPLQTASHSHLRHIQSVWAHWYAVHEHMAVASNNYTHSTWVRFCGLGSLVESIWCHHIMVEADSQLKLLLASILDI